MTKLSAYRREHRTATVMPAIDLSDQVPAQIEDALQERNELVLQQLLRSAIEKNQSMDVENQEPDLRSLLEVFSNLREASIKHQYFAPKLGRDSLAFENLLSPYITEKTVSQIIDVLLDLENTDKFDSRIKEFGSWALIQSPSFSPLVYSILFKSLKATQVRKFEEAGKHAADYLLSVIKEIEQIRGRSRLIMPASMQETIDEFITYAYLGSLRNSLFAESLFPVFDDQKYKGCLGLLNSVMKLAESDQPAFLNIYFKFLEEKLAQLTKKATNFDLVYQFYSQQFDLIATHFEGFYPMKVELTRAFERLNREDPDRAADLLSRHFSEQMGVASDLDYDALLTLFKHLAAKDIFMKLYNQRLIRRLVSEKYQSVEKERGMVEKFKEYAGDYFIHLTETLLLQFEKSSEVMTVFEQHFKRSSKKSQLSIDLETVKIFVFPSHVWPFVKFIQVEEYLPGDVLLINDSLK